MPLQCPSCHALLSDAEVNNNRCANCDTTISPNQTSILPRLSNSEPEDTLPPFSQQHPENTCTCNNFVNININQRIFKISSPKESEAKKDIDYTIIKTLGKGGMGTVFQATQQAIGRDIAIKIANDANMINHDATQKICNEAAITGRLEHPNIVPIYDLGLNNEQKIFYAMKLVEGTPWSDVIEAKSLQQNIEIILDICDGIAFAHSQGIIHRDLKPDNIMLGKYGEVLISDWGLAAGANENSFAPVVSYEEAIAGTPAYMAPEMALGYEDKINEQSDIYLLGAILYEIITGEPPHKGKNVAMCLYNASNNTITEPWIKSELIKTALKAMATRQSERYETVLDFKKAIKTHYESVEIATRAKKLFLKGKDTNKYSLIIKAIFGFQNAIEKWEDNEEARKSLAESTEYLATCTKKQDDMNFTTKLISIIND